MLILTVIRVLIDSVVRPQNNSALECPCCLDYLRLCCNSPFNLLCFKIGESHSAMKCGKCLMRCGNPDRHSAALMENFLCEVIISFIRDYPCAAVETHSVPPCLSVPQTSRKQSDCGWNEAKTEISHIRSWTWSVSFWFMLFCIISLSLTFFNKQLPLISAQTPNCDFKTFCE